MMELLSNQIAQGPGRNQSNVMVTMEDYQKAVRLYEEMRIRKEKRIADAARLQLEQERQASDILKQAAEAKRLADETEIEHRRLDIEAEKVVVQKAEVVMRALEIAERAGADGSQILAAIQGLSTNLLGDRGNLSPAVLQLAESKKEST